MIYVVEGDILNATEQFILHQVNTLGVMSGGLALQIRNKYPEVYDAYVEYVMNSNDIQSLLGNVQTVITHDGKVIANLFAQTLTTDYIALESSLRKTLSIVKFLGNKTVAIPYFLGCGIGGGNWNIVYKIIEEVFGEYDVTIYKFEP